MKITQITDKHLLNRIRFFEKKLSEKPPEAIYTGDSDIAEDWVNQENIHNENLALDIMAHLKYMKSEARKRGILK